MRVVVLGEFRVDRLVPPLARGGADVVVLAFVGLEAFLGPGVECGVLPTALREGTLLRLLRHYGADIAVPNLGCAGQEQFLPDPSRLRSRRSATARGQCGSGLRGSGGGPVTTRARYVVGCDGGRSVIRQTAGIGFPGTPESMTAVVGDFAVADHAGIDRARRHGVLVARLEAGLTRFVVMDPHRIRVPSTEPVTLEEFRTSLVRVCGTDCAIDEPRWLSRFGNTTRLAESYRRNRVLLAGDAAHIHFPVGAQGLNTGLQDAMNLGWKLAAHINGWAPPMLLDSYHTERHAVGHIVTTGTRAQTLLVELPLTEQYGRPGRILCELLDTLLGMEEVNRKLAGRVSGLDTAYPPLAPSCAGPLSGRRMPDIALTTSDNTRVFELLHDGHFVLLNLEGNGESLMRARVADGPGRLGPLRTVTAHAHDTHPDLGGVKEVLIRPDGHIAWATRTTVPHIRRTERAHALSTWTGAPAG
ncbi:FAD-dependent monooxygenase [Streptomyces sp. ISL-11]|uniref:FAD-dependent monooxygenase n=1 Tax=Streptomyces sp. ISL-11 TaxID=2819174 RepID=UPI001BE73EF3|nr:FAD-dependent monooxygenase [Streptomyces sp. ISL-11]MBT2382886.1 FAD-dependent monooxygenase [Streptomyces sp. ISL-11]